MAASLGLDIGEKRVGVALAHGEHFTAVPLLTIERRGRQHLLEELTKLVGDYKVDCIVVGLPKTLKGEIGPQAQKVMDEVEWLKARLQKTWVYSDERFSSLEVERVMLEGNVSAKKRRQVRDQLAAQRILQSFLDAERTRKNADSG